MPREAKNKKLESRRHNRNPFIEKIAPREASERRRCGVALLVHQRSRCSLLIWALKMSSVWSNWWAPHPRQHPMYHDFSQGSQRKYLLGWSWYLEKFLLEIVSSENCYLRWHFHQRLAPWGGHALLLFLLLAFLVWELRDDLHDQSEGFRDLLTGGSGWIRGDPDLDGCDLRCK